MPDADTLSMVRNFFERDVCRRATEPLRKGIEIALLVDGESALTLTKTDRPVVEARVPAKPDLTFEIPKDALVSLAAETTEDIGEIGVAILKLMANSDPKLRIKAKVHIGPFDLFRHGYLGVLPLGGGTVMKFLASKGFTGIGKIKEGISKLKG